MYALGIILNEMTARRPPWKYDTPFQVIYAVSVKQERPEIPASCPAAFAKLIQRCWHQDVKGRPSAVEMVAELSVLIEGLNKS
jgi:serine/threonine protein kinase